MSYKTDPLWQRIETYQFDDKDAFQPFSEKLRGEQSWSAGFTSKAIREYKKFIYLCCVCPEGASPSPVVDAVWHLHLTYTVAYWSNFCEGVLGRKIHHHPSKGGFHEKAKHAEWYGRTLLEYHRVFEDLPPCDVWPHAHPRYVEQEQLNIERGIFFEAGTPVRFVLLFIPFAVSYVYLNEVNPFLLKGPDFLVFYPLLVLCTVAVLLWSFAAKQSRLRKLMQGEISADQPYEVAYLAGGPLRCAMLIAGEMINDRALSSENGEDYTICHDHIGLRYTPLTESLSQYHSDTIAFNEYLRLIAAKERVLGGRFIALKKAYDRVRNNITLPVIVLVFGIARVLQGWINDKPVLYLIFMVFGAFMLFGVVSRLGEFHRAARSVLKQDISLAPVFSDPFYHSVVFHGIEALAMSSMFVGLSRNFARVNNSPSGGDWSSGCGSSGCSGGGGSSCGGGCGGCGGGD